MFRTLVNTALLKARVMRTRENSNRPIH